MKKTIEELIKSYQEKIKEIKGKMKAWEADIVYTDKHKKEQISKLQDEVIQLDKPYNEQLKNHVSNWKSKIFGEPKSKSADYQVQISNALKFIELAGNTLTDEQAYKLLEPFQGDFETMELFKNVVSKLTQGGGVWKSFEKTFGKTNRLMSLNDSFELIEQTAGTLFDSGDGGLVHGVKMSVFMDSIDSIQQTVERLDADEI